MSEYERSLENFIGLRNQYYKQTAQQDEILAGESAVRDGLCGLRAKLGELQKKLDKERTSKYPDKATIKRIEDKMLQIGGILNKSANCYKISPKTR